MQTRSGTIRHESDLAVVLQEIVAKLLQDDWMRLATADEASYYYIAGMKAHIEDNERQREYMSLAVSGASPLTTLGEQQVYGQVAAPRSPASSVHRASARLIEHGVDIDNNRLRQFLEGSLDDLSFLKGEVRKLNRAGFLALCDFLVAVLLAKGVAIEASEAERRSEGANAVSKIYLQELTRLYGNVVKRAEALDVLEFADPQLNEASRCYLYGFFRATVVLSGSALESNLSGAIGLDGQNQVELRTRTDEGRRRGYFDCLVDEAESRKVLGVRSRPGEASELVSYSRTIFDERTAVVHRQKAVDATLAEETLTKARKVVEFLRSRGDR